MQSNGNDYHKEGKEACNADPQQRKQNLTALIFSLSLFQLVILCGGDLKSYNATLL